MSQYSQLGHRARSVLERTKHSLLIDGRWVASHSDTTFPSYAPQTGAEIGAFALADSADTDLAVAAAQRAFADAAWRDLGPDQRSALLWRVAELADTHAVDLAQLESLDTGKPISAALETDVAEFGKFFRYFAGWVSKIEGRTIPINAPQTLAYTLRQPVGVCALIIPWNYPLMMASWKLAPALAAGCTTILKPAEQTPLSALLMGELFLEAGFPPGVVNILTGDGATTGTALTGHRGIDKVAFTGSTEVGRIIVRASADSNLKKVSLELGGKSPHIIFQDADLDRAIPGASSGVFYNAGQACTAGTRLLVHRDIAEQVTQGLLAEAARLRPGPEFDPETRLGPLISAEQVQRVRGYIDIARTEGAQVHTVPYPDATDTSELYVEPTVLVGATNSMRSSREEIFGPVVSIITFESEAEAIHIANDTHYGLGAGLWTRDLARAHRVAARLQSGSVWVNVYGPVDAALPFGGFKESGWGREMGEEAIRLYTEHKSIWMNLDG
ncbi:MAG: aldehyde dehydrogenase family protein [Beutenbergiaceae bacterium]